MADRNGALRCIITDFMGEDAEFERGALEAAGVDVYVAESAAQADWLDLVGSADAVTTRHAPLDGDAIAQLTCCKVIARYGTGVDNIDTLAAHAGGIVVTYVPGGSTDEVADHAMGLIVMAARALLPLAASVRDGRWVPAGLPPIRRLRGLTLGLIGAGRIGRALAARASAFGMEVAACDPALERSTDWAMVVDSVDELLPQADVVSLHAPLTPATRGLIGARELQLMRPGAILVNTARGALLDLDAAAAALEAGHLGGLALDAFPQEPLPAAHPIRRAPHTVLTPHMAYQSTESLALAKRSVVAEVLAVLAGEDPEHPWAEPGDAPTNPPAPRTRA